jgi:hypothetical protein
MMSNKTYKALMIDPFDQSTSVVDLAVDEYGSILGSSKAVMDCSTIDIITLNDKHMAIVDDEGLLRSDTRYSRLAEYPQPLAGRILVVGYDEDGESCSINHGYIDELRMTTRFLSEDFGGVEPKFEIKSWS